MNLKILFMLLLYYTIISLVFALGGAVFSEDTGYNFTNPLNSSDISSSEVDTGGLFGTGISFGRWLGLVTIGVGLPNDTPTWFAVMFSAWSILFLIFTVGFIISAIWNG